MTPVLSPELLASFTGDELGRAFTVAYATDDTELIELLRVESGRRYLAYCATRGLKPYLCLPPSEFADDLAERRRAHRPAA